MAKLLLINARSERRGINNIGDVVGIYDDKHKFSPKELTSFDMLHLPSFTTKQLEIGEKTLLPDMTSKIVQEEHTTKTYINVKMPQYKMRVKNPLGATINDIFETNVDADVSLNGIGSIGK